MRTKLPARFKVGDHVKAEGRCGIVVSAYEAASGGSWAYGVAYDDHTPLADRPFGSPGHAYAEFKLEAVENGN